MKIGNFIAAVCMLGVSACYAQNATGLIGQWMGTTKSPATGGELQIQVVIGESKSVWKFNSPSALRRPNPCFDREFPLAVQSSTSGKFVLNVDGSSVIQGCPSFFVNLELTDPRTLSGAFGDGRPAVLRKM